MTKICTSLHSMSPFFKRLPADACAPVPFKTPRCRSMVHIEADFKKRVTKDGDNYNEQTMLLMRTCSFQMTCLIVHDRSCLPADCHDAPAPRMQSRQHRRARPTQEGFREQRGDRFFVILRAKVVLAVVCPL